MTTAPNNPQPSHQPNQQGKLFMTSMSGKPNADLGTADVNRVLGSASTPKQVGARAPRCWVRRSALRGARSPLAPTP